MEIAKKVAEFTVVRKPNFRAKAEKITQELKRAAEREAQFLRGDIVKRTQSGKGIEGGDLKDYSPEYKKLLIREGEGTNVDLTRTQKMLGAIQARVREISGGLEIRLFFASAAESAKARWNSALRPFFGISKQQYNQLIQAINGAIKKGK